MLYLFLPRPALQSLILIKISHNCVWSNLADGFSAYFSFLNITTIDVVSWEKETNNCPQRATAYYKSTYTEKPGN